MNFDGVDSRIMGVKISLICESTSIMVIYLLLITVSRSNFHSCTMQVLLMLKLLISVVLF